MALHPLVGLEPQLLPGLVLFHEETQVLDPIMLIGSLEPSLAL